MITHFSAMKRPWRVLSSMQIALLIFLCFSIIPNTCKAQDDGSGGMGISSDADGDAPPPPDKEIQDCNGIFISYRNEDREKIYPYLKNASAQPYSFTSTATVLNAGSLELKAWMMYVQFQHDEILVAADGAVVMDGDSFPIKAGKNGTRFTGFPQADLKTAIDTAGDLTQMQVQIKLKGTQFGVKPPAQPMPKTIRLENDGYKCPAPKKKPGYMYACCVRDPKSKAKNIRTKFLPRQYGDLSMVYDIMQAFDSKYMAQVTIDNINPIGRLDHWNLTWEWMNNEFIYNMRGAVTHKKDPSECIYGPQGKYYADLDFSQVMNCEKKPTISDLPPDRKDDAKMGKLPYCCRNGSILPTTMNATQARSIFQLEVFKLPPDMNRTAISPPQNWAIDGVVNPKYECGPPIRIDPSEFPDPAGLDSNTYAIASWQVTCNITRRKPKQSRCCVSYSAYYADSAVPCPTCACGCSDNGKCDQNAKALPLPPEALLVPFDNRTEKLKAWSRIKHLHLPQKLPCPDNCPVSINWHLDTDFKSGWTARITLFNWGHHPFEDWFAAVTMNKAFPGYENVYSFNGTKLTTVKNTIFLQGLPGLNYLVGEVNGTDPAKDPPVPGKQQSVISFLKKDTPNINIAKGDGFPTKFFFNGEECALPTDLPKSSARRTPPAGLLTAVFLALVTFVLMADRFH